MSGEPCEREVDYLVAGAGPGGMTTALVGALEGMDVLLCEKSGQVGGTGSTSAGTLWIPGNQQSREAGFDDTAEKAEIYMDALIGGDTNRTLRTAYLATGPEAITYLMTRTDVQFVPCGLHPDYQPNRPGAATTGRALVPGRFDGRLLGADFERVRPPIPEFMVFGGMMVGKDDIPRLVGRFRTASNFVYSMGLFARYLRDRLSYSRGTRVVMGNALVARLYYSLRKAKVPVLFDTCLVELMQDDSGAVVGAILNSGGQLLRIRARKGVVLATGGYAHNKSFRDAFMPQPIPTRSLAAASDTGDGMEIGVRIGARVASEEHGSGAFWTPVSVTRRGDGTKGLFPHLSLDRAKPGLIAVNKAGRRFVNEGNSYHDFVEAMFEANKLSPTIPAYLICETAFIQKYGLGAIYPGTRTLSRFEASGYIVTAPSLGDLARKAGIDADGLAATVARHNEFARTGRDLDFGKGETELNRFNGDAANKPNPCLAPISTGPFCALEVWPAEIACSTGLSTDENARVLKPDGLPIAGLYACGNDMASIMAGTYPGPGTTLGPAIAFGYRAALHAAHSGVGHGRTGAAVNGAGAPGRSGLVPP